ncbi:hypothetical protein J6590_025418 [Homalodisca vitripennis]|nr:hypothetical protein J6590_025418 [Homalodisca vitripennis]
MPANESNFYVRPEILSSETWFDSPPRPRQHARSKKKEAFPEKHWLSLRRPFYSLFCHNNVNFFLSTRPPFFCVDFPSELRSSYFQEEGIPPFASYPPRKHPPISTYPSISTTPCYSDIMGAWSSAQCTFEIKDLYKKNDSVESDAWKYFAVHDKVPDDVRVGGAVRQIKIKLPFGRLAYLIVGYLTHEELAVSSNVYNQSDFCWETNGTPSLLAFRQDRMQKYISLMAMAG